MTIQLNGASRVYYVVGDPIAQVKSPQGVTELMQQQGVNAACIPAHVAPEQLAAFAAGVKPIQNIDGVIVTVHTKWLTKICVTACRQKRHFWARSTPCAKQ